MKKTFLKNKKNIQFLIIGLGLIGGSVAKRLSKNGFEVLAIDKNKSHLKYAKKSKIIIGSSEKTNCEKKLFVIIALPPKVLLNNFDNFSFTLKQAAATGIIGGADGPTAIYVASILAPELLGAIAVAAYSYMALVPLIQPPIMKALTTQKEKAIVMNQLRNVSQKEKIFFPIILLLLVALFLPSAAPLLGMFCFGNLLKESQVVERLSEVVQNSLINIVTIFLGLSVGSQLLAEKFLTAETLGILVLGVIAFAIGTASGVLMAKIMNLFSKNKINPLIGAAGVSAVPMAARVANKVGLEYNSQNFLLMHAMGPNVAGVIGSAVAAGIMIKLLY